MVLGGRLSELFFDHQCFQRDADGLYRAAEFFVLDGRSEPNFFAIADPKQELVGIFYDKTLQGNFFNLTAPFVE